MNAAQHDPDLDLDQDLFDFGEVERDSAPEPEEDLDELLAAFHEPAQAEELLAVPIAAATVRPAAPAGRPDRESVRAVTAPPEVTVALPLETRPAPRGPRFSRGLLAIALAVTLVNSILGVVVLRSSPQRHDVQAVAGAGEAARASAPHEQARGTPALVGALPDPESAGTVPDHPALVAAREEISHGQYAPARQRVYALLAVIDRTTTVRRESLEAECQFLIAQALHLEALDRMGGAR